MCLIHFFTKFETICFTRMDKDQLCYKLKRWKLTYILEHCLPARSNMSNLHVCEHLCMFMRQRGHVCVCLYSGLMESSVIETDYNFIIADWGTMTWSHADQIRKRTPKNFRMTSSLCGQEVFFIYGGWVKYHCTSHIFFPLIFPCPVLIIICMIQSRHFY